MELWNQYVDLVDGWKIISLPILIAVNLVFGIAVSLKTGTFNFAESADWLKTRVLPFVISYLAVGVAALAEPSLEVSVPVAYSFIVTFLVAKILKNYAEVGLPLPEALKSRLVSKSG